MFDRAGEGRPSRRPPAGDDVAAESRHPDRQHQKRRPDLHVQIGGLLLPVRRRPGGAD